MAAVAGLALRAAALAGPPSHQSTRIAPSLRLRYGYRNMERAFRSGGPSLPRASSSSPSTPAGDAAPEPGPGPRPGGGLPTPVGPGPLKIIYKRALKELSSLPRAIYTMAAIAGLSGLGTIIEQNQSIDYYTQNYPEGPSQVLGFLTWRWIVALQLDHVYTAWYFWALLAFLAASLAACTFTRQLPVAKVAQRWRFVRRPQAFAALGRAELLPNARVQDLGAQLGQRGYQVFVKEGALYAFKGMAGRLGPIGVHAALLLVMAGTTASAFAGLKGTAMVPQGQEFVIGQALRPTGWVGFSPAAQEDVLHVNSFDIDYRPDGSVAQFYSDLSVVDASGRELTRQKISVNKPLRYGGVTMYQTDWEIAGVNVRVVNSGNTPLGLPMVSLEGREGVQGKLFASYLPIELPTEARPSPRGISFLARDLQSIALYDSKGEFAGVRRPGSGKPITVDGVELVVDSLVGATGLELKSDPGVPVVYAGFGALMITTIVSYLSHSQVWGLQQGAAVYVAGRSNRALYFFNQELDEVLNAVPELPAAAPAPAASAITTQERDEALNAVRELPAAPAPAASATASTAADALPTQ